MIHLYSDPRCPFSHIARLVLNFKGMDFQIVDVSVNRQDLESISSANITPVLLDDIDRNNKRRNLLLEQTDIICEYIDERFPHPQLMPIEPTERARLRMLLRDVYDNLLSHVRVLDNHLSHRASISKKDLEKVKKLIVHGIDDLAHVFTVNRKAEFLFGNSFSLLDAAILPLLWRVRHYNLEHKDNWDFMIKYAKRLFDTDEFMASLTPAERGMR